MSGETHYRSAISAVTRKGARDVSALTICSEVGKDVARREPGRKLRWFEAELLPRPDDPHDANAVAVVSPFGQVGHLPRENAAEYAGVFSTLRQLSYDGAMCPAFLDVEKQSVVLALSWPSFCLPAVNAERRKQAWDAWDRGSDLDIAAGRLGYAGLSTLLKGAREYAKDAGLAMPPTATELRRQKDSARDESLVSEPR